MILGNVERLKVVVIVLDIGAASDLEAHARKDIDDLVDHERQRVHSAALPARPGKGDVDPLVFARLGAGLLFDLPGARFDPFLEQFPQMVQLLAGPRALFRRKLLKAPQHERQPAATA